MSTAVKGAQAWDIRLQGFWHKSILYGLVNKELDQKIQNFDGLGWFRVEIRHFVLFSAAAYIAKNNKRCHDLFYRCRWQRLNK